MAFIQRLAKGDKNRTMMHADVANEVIDAVNPLLALTVTPDEFGCRFTYGDYGLVLDLTGLKNYIASNGSGLPAIPGSDDYVLSSRGGAAASWENSIKTSGVYIGSACFEASNVTLETGSGNGFYIENTSVQGDGIYINGSSTYLTSTYLQVTGGANITSNLYAGSLSAGTSIDADSGSITNNLDAGSLSTRMCAVDGFKYTGTELSLQTVTICNDDGSTSTMQVLGTAPA